MKEYLLYFPTSGTNWAKVLSPFLGEKPKYQPTDRDHVMVECEPKVMEAIKAANPTLMAEELM